MSGKTQQLQIRVTPAQKAALKRLARQARQDVSTYVLGRALPDAAQRVDGIVAALRTQPDHRYALAELNDLLSGVTTGELRAAVEHAPTALRELSPLQQNYVAAMVEYACAKRGVPVPPWTASVAPLDAPHFAAPLRSLRLHLLRESPIAFKRRNIFVDASVGARV